MLRAVVLFIFVTISGIHCASLSVAGAIDNDDPRNVKEYSCINCTAVQLNIRHWNGTSTKLREFTCDSTTPYCDPNSGTCSSRLSNDTCAQQDSTFICSNDGYFPHPIDCHKYYSCIKGKAYLLDCGLNFYNAKSEYCQENTPCYYFNCASKSGVKIPHGSDSSFFAYCYNNTVARVDRCPGRFKLDTNLQSCVPVCEVEGHQGDPFDCTRYYKCYYESKSSSVLSLEHNQCADGELYDALNFHCATKNTGVTCATGQT